MDMLQDWINEDNRWVVMALIFGFVVLLLTALPHSARVLRYFGARK